jgi:hypothetical protein
MNATDALRFVDHEAAFCRGRDSSEALCLLLPPLMMAMGLEPMSEIEAAAFRHELRKWVADHPRVHPRRLQPYPDP